MNEERKKIIFSIWIEFLNDIKILYSRNIIMAVSFTHLSWWLWSGKHQEPRISNGSSLNSSSPESAMWESDALKFPLVRRANVASASSRRVKRKWHSREERKKIDREYDLVLVPSDGGCVSGSESDDSDWSVGWLEPHGPEFQSDDDTDNSFAVLVPCYGRGLDEMVDNSKNIFFGTVGIIPDGYSAESKKNMEEWLSSLQKS